MKRGIYTVLAISFVLVFSIVLVSATSRNVARATNLAVTSLEVTTPHPMIHNATFLRMVAENKYGTLVGPEKAILQIRVDPPTGVGYIYTECCKDIYSSKQIRLGEGEPFIFEFGINIQEEGEYKVTTSILPRDKYDINIKDNSKTVSFVV